MFGLGLFILLASFNLQKAEDLYQHRHFQESLSVLPDNATSPEVEFLQARDLFQLESLKDATEILLTLTKQQPNNSEYFDWLGKVYGRRAETGNPLSAPGLATKAREAFEEAVRLDASNKDALSDLFDFYADAPSFLGGGLEKAEQIAVRNQKVNPPEALFELAVVAEKQKDYVKAEANLRRAMEAAPDASGYPLALARLLARQERFAEADAIAEKTIESHPDRPRVLFNYASMLVKEKRKEDQAQALLKRYLESSLTADDPSPDQARKLLKQISN